MYSSKNLKRIFVLVACLGLVALMGCSPEVPEKWKGLGLPLGEAELRLGEEQNANHLSVEHLDTSAHQEICEQYKAKLKENGYKQDEEAENKSNTDIVVRTMVSDGETVRLQCRDAADRAIVKLDVQ
jgi:hypothetical protein